MYEAVVIGVSAGGMEALGIIIPKLPKDFSLPVIVVQHRREDSDSFLSEYFNKQSAVSVREPDEKELVQPGNVYIAPAGYHLLIEDDRSFSLSMEPRVNFARPSIDVLFESAADVYEDRLAGVILTGANSDGSQGLKKIRQAGGLCIVQNPGTAKSECMPCSAIQACQPDHILELKDIAHLLCQFHKRQN